MDGAGTDFSALGGRDAVGGEVVRMDLNTGPHPPGFSERLLPRLGDIEEYGAERADLLRSRLADLHPGAVDADSIVLGAGSMDVLRMAAQDLADEGGTAVVQTPGYPGFRRLCAAVGLPTLSVPRGEGFATDTGALLDAVHSVDGPALVYLNHPVNPVGVAEDLSVIDKVLAARSDAVVLVDEAYADFHDQAEALEASAAAGTDRLIVTRSFSKARGLAGIRLGYAVTGHGRADRWRRAQLPGAISGLSQAAALASLDEDPLEFGRRMEALRRQRDRLADQLGRELGVAPVPSIANFLLFPIGPAAGGIATDLLAAGVAVKLVAGEPGLPDSLRITVGDEPANDLLLAAVEGGAHGG
jgi:histidinol-phosphate aminotransferase